MELILRPVALVSESLVGTRGESQASHAPWGLWKAVKTDFGNT